MRLPSQPLPVGLSDGRLTSREWIVLVLGALVLTVFVCVTEPSIFGSTDWVRMHGFYKAYIQESVAHGRLPLWNPNTWLGRPFLADIESAFFYPPEWLYFFLDIHIACALTCAVHFVLILYGTLKLSRALGTQKLTSFFVAFVLALSAPIVGCFTSGLIHYGQALCYTPLVFYLGMRVQNMRSTRDVALLALVLGLEVLCGHPQAAWITQLGLAVFLIGRRLGRPLLPSLAGLGIDLGLAGGALLLGLASWLGRAIGRQLRSPSRPRLPSLATVGRHLSFPPSCPTSVFKPMANFTLGSCRSWLGFAGFSGCAIATSGGCFPSRCSQRCLRPGTRRQPSVSSITSFLGLAGSGFIRAPRCSSRLRSCWPRGCSSRARARVEMP